MVYATVSDLESRWRTLTTPERERAGTLLGDAAVRLDVVCPPTDPPTERELSVRLIVSCEMVKRAMSSPGEVGVTQYSETTGPFTNQVTYANPTGDLYLSKSDRSLLRCGAQVAFTVPLVPPS